MCGNLSTVKGRQDRMDIYKNAPTCTHLGKEEISKYGVLYWMYCWLGANELIILKLEHRFSIIKYLDGYIEKLETKAKYKKWMMG